MAPVHYQTARVHSLAASIVLPQLIALNYYRNKVDVILAVGCNRWARYNSQTVLAGICQSTKLEACTTDTARCCADVPPSCTHKQIRRMHRGTVICILSNYVLTGCRTSAFVTQGGQSVLQVLGVGAGGDTGPGSPAASTNNQPYSYGGDGHFGPPPSGIKANVKSGMFP